MADDRVIASAIRIHDPETRIDTVYGPGQEDELAAVLTKEQLKRFTEGGELQGTWKSVSNKAAAETETKK